MRILDTSYDIWKQVVLNNSFNTYFLPKGTSKGMVWAGNRDLIYETHVSADAWEDFETNFPSGVYTEVAREGDAIAQIVGLSDIQQQSISEYGGLIVSTTHDAVLDDCEYMGFSFVASGNAVTIHDERIEYVIRVHGGHTWICSGCWGDDVSFSVVDKDNVLGLFAYFGIPEGQGVLELGRLVRNNPVVPNPSCGYFEASFDPPTVSEVLAGLYFRTTYDNNHDEDVYIGANLLTYRV